MNKQQDITQLVQLTLINGQIGLDTSQLQKYLKEMKEEFTKQLNEIEIKYQNEINQLKQQISELTSNQSNQINQNNQQKITSKQTKTPKKNEQKESKKKEIKEKENKIKEIYQKKEISPLDEQIECSICLEMIDSDKVIEHIMTHNGNNISEEEQFQQNQQIQPIGINTKSKQRNSTQTSKRSTSKITTQNQLSSKKQSQTSKSKKLQQLSSNQFDINQNDQLYQCEFCLEMIPESKINDHFMEMHVNK